MTLQAHLSDQSCTTHTTEGLEWNGMGATGHQEMLNHAPICQILPTTLQEVMTELSPYELGQPLNTLMLHKFVVDGVYVNRRD